MVARAPRRRVHVSQTGFRHGVLAAKLVTLSLIPSAVSAAPSDASAVDSHAARPAGVLTVKDFGAVGDGVTDDSAAFKAACAAADKTGGILFIPSGTYAKAQIRMTRGFRVLGLGNPVVETLQIGDVPLDGAGQLHEAVIATAVTADAAAGAASVHVVKAAALGPGDWVLIASRPSSYSSPRNWIPKYYQYVRIQSVSGDTLRFDQYLRYPFAKRDGALVIKNPRLVVNGVVEGISFHSTSQPYIQFVQASLNTTIRNCVFLGTNAFGAAVFSDGLVYENIRVSGVYSGLSAARGTGRVVFRNCTVELNPTHNENYVAYWEESVEDVLVENSTLIGGRIVNTALEYPDAPDGIMTANRRIRYVNSRFLNPTGAGILQMSAAYVKNEFESCVLEAAHGFVDEKLGLTTPALIGVAFSAADPVSIFRSRIISNGGDRIYAVGHAGAAPRLVDTTCVGARPVASFSTVVVPDGTTVRTEIASPVRYGTRYASSTAGGRIQTFVWELRGLPPGSYRLFDADVSDGAHFYSVRLHGAVDATPASYSAKVTQAYGEAPLVRADENALSGARLVAAARNATATTMTLETTARTAEYVIEIECWYRGTPRLQLY